MPIDIPYPWVGVGSLTITVKINNKWYLCDATWSSGLIDLRNKKFIPHFEEVYFLTPPDLFVENHLPIDQKWTLTEQSISKEEFINHAFIYKSAIAVGLKSIYPTQYEVYLQTKEMLTLCFKLEDKQLLGLVKNEPTPTQGYGVSLSAKSFFIDSRVGELGIPQGLKSGIKPLSLSLQVPKMASIK